MVGKTSPASSWFKQDDSDRVGTTNGVQTSVVRLSIDCH